MNDAMSRTLFGGALLLAGLLSAAAAHAQPPRDVVVRTFSVCDGRQCTRFEWRELAIDPRRHHLFAGGRQLGAWCYRQCIWRDFDGRTWGPPKLIPPFPVPGIAAEPAPPETPELPRVFGQPPPPEPVNHGIDLDRLRAAGRTYTRNGQACDRRTSFEALGQMAGALPDDADAIRLTIIGDAAAAEQLRRDLEQAPALAEWRGKVAVQAFAAADDPLLRGLGFQPGLQIQSADGRRLGADAGYPGPELLAEGLRNADRRRRDPNWRPTVWPPLRDPEQPRPLDGLRDLAKATAWMKRNGLAIGVVLVLLTAILTRRRPSPA